MEEPIIHNRRSLSPIWILPLVALCIGGWLLYTGMRDAGVDITVHFTDATGINPGKTKVIVRGIPVGTVKTLNIDPDMKGVNLVIAMDNQAKPSLVQDTAFWIVKPEVSAGKISGLDTLFGGSYIGMRRGTSNTAATVFQGLSSPPAVDNSTPGLHILLETKALYSVQRGSNIYSKNLQIGYIEDYALQPSGIIQLRAFIESKYAPLIHTGTRFWNASGLNITGDVQSGLTVNVESVASLIYGGLSCDTPPTMQDSAAATNGTVFQLYKDFEDAQYGIPAWLELSTGEGIVAGKTKVIYRGLKAGVVKKVDINDDPEHSVTAELLLDPRAEPALRSHTRFWIVRPQVQISGVKHLDTLVTGPYVTFEIGDGSPQDKFVEQTTSMPEHTNRPGTTFTLTAPSSHGLQEGAPILYKDIAVGDVTSVKLTPKGDLVLININVFDPYTSLVTAKTIFWKTGGFKLDAALTKVKMELGSVESLLLGGIAFTTPPGKNTPAAAENTRFSLYPSYGDAVKAIPEIEMQGLRLDLVSSQAPQVQTGSPILYNSIRVGEILGRDLARNHHDTIIHILIDQQYRDLVNTQSRFYQVSPVKLSASLRGVNLETAPFEAMVNGGIALMTSGEKGSRLKQRSFPLYASLIDAQNADALHLHLRFPSGEDVNASTEIRSQGVTVGRLYSLTLNPETGTVRAEATVDAAMASLFRKQTRLRLIKPEVSITGIKNVGTILSGAYIDVEKGSGSPSRDFNVLPFDKDCSLPQTGLNIILETSSLGSLKKGSPIYYRRMQVGEITGYSLSPTAQEVWLLANIHEPYRKLIYSGTRFWNASGVSVKAGLISGVNVRTESVESLLAGGIGLATPDGPQKGGPAYTGEHFKVSETLDEDWLKWQPALPSQPAATKPATGSKR